MQGVAYPEKQCRNNHTYIFDDQLLVYQATKCGKTNLQCMYTALHLVHYLKDKLFNAQS